MKTDLATPVKSAVVQTKRGPRSGGLTRQQKEWISGLLFLAPDFIGTVIFLVIPMVIALGLGFFEVDGFGNFSFVGMDNYVQMFSDTQFLASLRVTLIYIVVLVPGLFVVSLILALLVKQRLPFIGVFRSMFFLPNVISLVVVGFVWKFILTDQVGVVNQILISIGLGQRSWLGDPSLALGTVLVVSIWFSMGYYMIIFLAGLQEIPSEYYEAAKLDGAGGWNSFMNITWPLLRPTSFFVLLVTLVSAVSGSQGFDLIYAMTKGGPAESTELGIFYIYEQAFQFSHYGYAAAMASFIVLILFVTTIVMFLLTKGGRFEYD